VLAEYLRGHPALRTLDLSYNPLAAAGTKHIADVAKFDLKVGVRPAFLQHLSGGSTVLFESNSSS
jgi:hypothetical protein